SPAYVFWGARGRASGHRHGPRPDTQDHQSALDGGGSGVDPAGRTWVPSRVQAPLIRRSRADGLVYHDFGLEPLGLVILTGDTALGKSYLAGALAHKASRDGYTVVYRRVAP